MAAKRSRTGEDGSMVSNTAQAVGKALGTAVSAIESVVGSRRKGPNGYQKMKTRGQQRATAADRPARSRSRKTATAAKPKTQARSRTARSRSRKAR
jgi:hypothetical protein